MAKKKKTEPTHPVARKCECWLDIGTCYCEEETFSSVRFSVIDATGVVHSRWETVREAMEDGRRRLPEGFNIFDNLEKRTIISYE